LESFELFFCLDTQPTTSVHVKAAEASTFQKLLTHTLQHLKTRKLRYFGHIMRHNCLEKKMYFEVLYQETLREEQKITQLNITDWMETNPLRLLWETGDRIDEER